MSVVPSVQVGGSGPDKLVFRMSGLQWQGNPEFVVVIDGVQVGGTQTVSAQFGPDTQDFVVSGDFGTAAHSVGIDFLNGASGDEWWQVRGLEVQNASVDGYSIAGGGFEMDSSGTAILGFTSGGWTVPAVAVGTGADTLVLKMDEDEWQGDARFTLTVDGVAVGGVQTVGAIRGAATQEFDVKGDFGAGPHSVGVTFLNDSWNWFKGADRNLYLESATYDGATVPTAGLALLSGGTQSLDFTAASATAADTLVVSAAEDAWQGDAQFSVAVDGVAVDGVYTVTASSAADASQDIVVRGDWGAGPHTVSVTFLNDAYGGYGADRNLYVRDISYDGVSLRTETPLTSTGDTFSLVVPATAPTPPAPGGLSLLGVNLSGAEYGTGSGTEGLDYRYPTGAEMDYWSAQGMDMIRLPVSWERLQPIQGGDLDPTQLAYLDTVVSRAAADGLKVDIDLHDYGFGYGSMVGSAGTPDASLADFWGRMAAHFKASPNVVFGVMNEPYAQTPQQWAQAAQGSVDAIRAAGATQEILVSGTGWDGAHDWTTNGNSSLVGSVVTDGLSNMAFEVHQYFDDGSGTSTAVASPTVGPDRLADATAWARATGNHLFLGEFASGSDSASTAALDGTLAYMKANADVWQGGTYWGAGWQDGYMFDPDPSHGAGSAQAAVLARYAPGH